jgi:hypothetical protein
MRQVSEKNDSILIAFAHQSLSPGCEEDADLILGTLCHPGDEAFQRLTIALVFGSCFAMFGKGTVITAIVATGERSAIENREVHSS